MQSVETVSDGHDVSYARPGSDPPPTHNLFINPFYKPGTDANVVNVTASLYRGT